MGGKNWNLYDTLEFLPRRQKYKYLEGDEPCEVYMPPQMPWRKRAEPADFPVGGQIAITDVPSAGSCLRMESDGVRWVKNEIFMLKCLGAIGAPLTGANRLAYAVTIPEEFLGPNGGLKVECGFSWRSDTAGKYVRVLFGDPIRAINESGELGLFGETGTLYSKELAAKARDIGVCVDMMNRNVQNHQVHWAGNKHGECQVDTTVDQLLRVEVDERAVPEYFRVSCYCRS